jgi:hypothetical protein
LASIGRTGGVRGRSILSLILHTLSIRKTLEASDHPAVDEIASRKILLAPSLIEDKLHAGRCGAAWKAPRKRAR